jgi:hypothetical protein
LVQSAVVASREAYLSQQAAIRARLAQQEGLVSVDAESVVSPWLGFAATPDSDAAGRAPPAEKRRERERSKTDSSSDKAIEGAEEDEDEEDEIERLLRRSRSTRRFGTPSVLLGEQQRQQQQQHHHRHQVSWSDVPVPAHEHIALAPLPPLDYQPTVPGGAVESADDLNEEEEDEIEISDGVRSCRLFTLASLEEDEVYQPVGAATNEQSPSANLTKVFATEPEFAFASTAATDHAPRSLASFEIPPHPSVSSSSSNSTKAGKGAFRRGGGGGGKGKGVGLGKQVEIRGLILVEGTYDIVRQAKWEHDCGIEEGEL